MKYLIDANSIIETHKRYYNIEIVPSFNDWLCNTKEIFTIKEVIDEIKEGRDNICDLIKEIYVFNVEDAAKIKYINEVTSYINELENKKEEEKNNFLKGADYLLVATALSNKENITIVTEEVKADEKAKKVKIPNVCKDFEIKCINMLQLIKHKKVKLSPEKYDYWTK